MADLCSAALRVSRDSSFGHDGFDARVRVPHRDRFRRRSRLRIAVIREPLAHLAWALGGARGTMTLGGRRPGRAGVVAVSARAVRHGARVRNRDLACCCARLLRAWRHGGHDGCGGCGGGERGGAATCPTDSSVTKGSWGSKLEMVGGGGGKAGLVRMLLWLPLKTHRAVRRCRGFACRATQ